MKRNPHLMLVLAVVGMLVTAPFAPAHGQERKPDQKDPKPNPAMVMYACLARNGDVRLVVAPDQCRPSETVMQWNVVGQQGPAGPQGPQGVPGPQGPQGIAGATGPQGPQGPAGPAGPAGQDGAIGPAGPAGPMGPEGPRGPQGATGPAGAQGAAGLNWRGNYVDGQTYEPNDAVFYDGSTWVAIVTTELIPAPKYAHAWQLLASAGDSGPQGPQGPQGFQGPQGPQGAIGPRAGLNFQEFWEVGNHEFVVPAGVTMIHVELWGAGGGGGVARTFGGGGGGGGGYYRGVVAVAPGQVIGVWVGEQGWGGYCANGDPFQSVSSTNGGDSGIFGLGEIRVKGGHGGGRSGTIGAGPGQGGNGGGWCESTWTGSITASACRAGERGWDGGAQPAFVPGGRTAAGSLPPFGFGGGAGGHRVSCDPGQNGNQGSVLITW